MDDPLNLEPVKSYFAQRIREHGTSPLGSDWNSEASQNIRFDQLLKVIKSPSFSLLDYGCGSGALANYLVLKGFKADYFGYDILESAIETARQVNAGKACHSFLSDKSQIPVCDYTVASGPFNFRAEHSHEAWTELIISELNFINRVSRKGFASNFLTKYSEPEKMRPDLYYADPLFLFDYCERIFSRNVALLHDYDLYDFTIIVRKE